MFVVDPVNGGSGGLPGIFSVNFTGGSFNVSTTVSFAVGHYDNFTTAYNGTVDIYQPVTYDPLTVMLDVGSQQPLQDATITLAINPIISSAATNETSAHVMTLNVWQDSDDGELLATVEAAPNRANASSDPAVTDSLLTSDFFLDNETYIAYAAVILLPFGVNLDHFATGRRLLQTPSTCMCGSSSPTCQGAALTSPLPANYDPATYRHVLSYPCRYLLSLPGQSGDCDKVFACRPLNMLSVV